MRLIEAAAGRRMRWKNGGGWTTEIARSDEPGSVPEAFRWRVSIAEIEADGPFSAFPGIERDLLLLEGNGIELSLGEAAQPVQLVRRFARLHFAGELAVGCRLLDGPTRDFNVMARRDAVAAEVFVRPLVGIMFLPPEDDVEWLIHVAAGHATARQHAAPVRLGAGDSLRLGHDGREAMRTLLDGAGELLMVKFRPAG